MTSPLTRQDRSLALPHFESLEDRLLLTTLQGGEYFVYLNSQDQAVRVDLHVGPNESASDAQIELLAHEDGHWNGVGVTDLVGFKNGNLNDRVIWDNGAGTTENIIEVNNGEYSWITNDPQNGVRGAQTEIYAIYVAKSTANTRITISTLASGDIDNDDFSNWISDVDTWSSDSQPILDVYSDGNITSPGGSGGVIVGAYRSPEPGQDGNKARHLAAADNMPEVVNNVIGMFPSGELAAGITFAPSAQFMPNLNLAVGSDVASIAVDSNGSIYVVNLGAFDGVISNTGTDGVVGQDVSSLASDSSGTFYAVDNAPTASVGNPTNDNLGVDVNAIAVRNDGVFFAVDEDNHHLVSWSSSGGLVDIGELIDQNESQFRYENVTGLDFNPANGLLYAIADVVDLDTDNAPDAPDPDGPFLITIDTATASVTSRLLIGGGSDSFASVAFNDAGTCYAVESNASGDSLVTINTSTGAVTTVGDLQEGVTDLVGFTGIDFIGGTLYGVTNQAVFVINPANGSCTRLGSAGFGSAMGSLAYDPTRPGSLYTAVDQSGYRLARIPLGASLTSTDADGTATVVGLLGDSGQDTWVWSNIDALAYRGSNDLLYAVATAVDLDPLDASDPPAGRRLVTIDPATGSVTDIGALTGAADIQALAFDAADNLYGVDTTTDRLYQINAGTGAGALVVALGVNDIVGIEFVTIGGNEVLFGVTATELYAINQATGAGTLLGDTGQTSIGSLAYDASQPNQLWSTASDNGFRLTKIDLSSSLIQSNGVDTVTQVGMLIDATEPAYAYVDIHALDFDGSDVLYAVGNIVNLDPVNVADPVSAGPYLLTIDAATGEVTRAVATPLDVADLSSLAYDAVADVWYGVEPDGAGDKLVTVDIATATTTEVDVLTESSTPITGVTGLDFKDGVLYAVTGNALYRVQTATADCSEVDMGSAALPSSLSGLSGDETAVDRLWSTAKLGNEYYLLAQQAPQPLDMERIVVAGTIAGQIECEGNIDVIDMGFLWGQVHIQQNAGAIIMRSGGGGIRVDASSGTFYATPEMWNETRDGNNLPVANTVDMSRITVNGTLGGVYSRSGVLYTGIQTEGDPTVAAPSSDIEEYETRVNPNSYDTRWIRGDLVDFTNDTRETAQFLSHPTGNFSLSGRLNSTYDGGQDWYALPLMAGQTVTIDGNVNSCVLKLYDSHGNFMDSFGIETNEDEGVGSRGSTDKPIVFTAPEAGVYYVQVEDTGSPGGSYQLDFTNGTAASLGAVSVIGDYGDGVADNELKAFLGTGTASHANIATKLGGNLGAVSISGISYGTVAHAIGGGDLIAFQAGQLGESIGGTYMGTNQIISDSNIGRIASTTGQFDASIDAGASSGFYNPNAYIQNIYVAGDYVMANNISATGSIGVIEVEGNVQPGVSIYLNSNNTNYSPSRGARLDLLDIGGDLSMVGSMFSHGPGGDFGYVHVGGTITVDMGSWNGPVQETTVTDGRTTILNDDGGGQLTVTPVSVPVLDSEGHYTYDSYGEIVTDTATYSYCYIPVNDYQGGVGGIIANLRIDGSASLTAEGLIQVSHLELSGTDSNVLLNGSGTADVYYVDGGQLKSLINETDGDIVSGSFDGIETISVRGSIGPDTGTTGAWLHGWENAPAVADVTTEPQYGWFHGKINGLNINGSIDTLRVNGSLHDLRVTGKIGNVLVNADRLTGVGRWDGVSGIVWSQSRIDFINVGDGLADDGGADIAKAAILSSGSIGEVKISGPYFTANNKAYGQINGSIIAMHDEYVTTVDEWGRSVVTEVAAIGKVTGTNGARLTGLVLAAELDSFQCSMSTFMFTGGVGEVHFSGATANVGAEINGAEIAGHYVRNVTAGINSNGIFNTYISGRDPLADQNVIGQVTAHGSGMERVFINANGGNIGTVKGVGESADIVDSVFTSTNGINYLGARDIVNSGIHMPGEVKMLKADRDIVDCVIKSGAVGNVVVKKDFEDNTVEVANKIRSIVVHGAFIDSYLALQGPSMGYLHSLIVDGNISGTITSAGKIGSIICRNGVISANVSTITNDWSGEIGLIQTAGGYTGGLDVAGTLKRFISNVSLGENPAVAGSTQTFNINGDMEYLKVGSRGVVAHLFAGINVGGDIGTLDVDGTFYSSMFVNGSINKLTVDGGFGGVLGGLGIRGDLQVLGDLKSLKFNDNSDLFADLTVGGTIKRISLKGGSIVGNLTSRYGTIDSISLVGGSITGDLTAVSIGRITVRDGNVTGDITATNGNIKSFSLQNGNLDASVKAQNGRIDRFSINTGTALGAGNTIEADGGIGRFDIRNGDLLADVISQQEIQSLSVQGNIGSVLDGALVDAEMGIGRLTVRNGGIVNSTVRSGSKIDNIQTDTMTNSIVSSAWNIGNVRINGNMTNSHLLSGYDVGSDGAIGGGDDAMHSGDIRNLQIRGLFNTSVVAAGINPGDDDFRTLGDNTDIDGVSCIYKASIAGVAGGSMLMADTYVDTKAPGAVIVAPGHTALAGAGVDFGPETADKTLTIGGLSLTLTGDGVANYNAATNHLILNRTTTRSSLSIVNTGANVTITIEGSEDSQLNMLRTSGAVTLGDVNIQGQVKRLTASTVSDGATWTLLGGSRSGVTVGNMTNVNVTAGEIGNWRMGSFTGGSLTADSIKRFDAVGSVTGDITSRLGELSQIDVRNGNLNGNVTSHGTVKRLSVKNGSVNGTVTVTNGDLDTVQVGGNLNGRVEATYGATKNVSIGNLFSGSFRTAEEIKAFTASVFSGLLSTDGDLVRLTVRGKMSGLARSGKTIKNASFGSLDGALVTAGNDFQNVRVNGNMLNSCVFAGFDPGDAGYDIVTGETGNLEIDAFGTPAADQRDRVFGGSINTVQIRGNMTDSTVSAAVGPGLDGYCGTSEDVVAGVGHIKRIKVDGAIYGSGNSCGVFAASEMPTVYHWSRYQFVSNGSAHTGTMQMSSGLLKVTDVQLTYNAITIFFNHPVNSSTVGTSYLGANPETLTLLVSDDNTFDAATDVVVSETVAHTLSCDMANYSVTMTLQGGQTWQTLSADGYYQLTLDGSVITDNRGYSLDGEYSGVFPSGDDLAGGDFVYEFRVGQAVLSNVPGYDWWHGCSATAGGMLVGYYDNILYNDLIDGDANDQTANPNINETIASSGDGQYLGDGTVVVAGTPGTGHIPDYALYDAYNDYDDMLPYSDLSSINPGIAHADDCIADFMLTSRSAEDLTMGATWTDNIGDGLVDFFAYKGYAATSTDEVWGMFTWGDLVTEINAGRPVLLNVDTGGAGFIDHTVIAVGYNSLTNQYACHRTWEVDDPATPVNEALFWYDFGGISVGQDYGIGSAVLVEVS